MQPNKLQLVKITTGLNDKLSDIDNEFKDFLAGLTYQRQDLPDKLKTFSPLDAVADFEQTGLQAVPEITREEMLSQETSFNKLLANMLSQCKPDALSEDDYNQISGINGREVQVGL